MQLSLSPANPPVPTATADFNPAGAEPAGGADSFLAVIGADASFEEYFPENSPPSPQDARPVSSEMEDAAGILTASFWMPAISPAAPAPVSPATESAPLPETMGETARPATRPQEINLAAQTFPGSTALSATGDAIPDAPAPQLPVRLRPEHTADIFPANDQPPGDEQVQGLVAAAAAGLPTDSAVPGIPNQRRVSTPGPKDYLPAEEQPEPGPDLTARTGFAGVESLEATKPAASVPENIAGFRATMAAAGAATPASEIKEILNPNHKAIAALDAPLGTGVAKSGPPMSFTPFNRTKTVAANQAPAPLPTGKLDFTAMLPPEVAMPVGTLREMMATVVSALDKLEQRWDSSPRRVDLEFQVGGEPVALRLELKEGTVHATFKTETVRMRAALTREWQAVMPSATVGLLRLAEPVFHAMAVGAAADTAFGSAGQEALPQRGQPTPEPVPFLRIASPADPEMSESLPAAESRSPASALLNAFA